MRDFCKVGDGTRDSINPDSVRIDRAGGPCLVAASIPQAVTMPPSEDCLAPSMDPDSVRIHRGWLMARMGVVWERLRSLQRCLASRGVPRRRGGLGAELIRLGPRVPPWPPALSKLVPNSQGPFTGPRGAGYAFSAVASRSVVGRCCGLSESWRYFYSISSATAIREAAVPEDRVL